MLLGDELKPGVYELVFQVGPYFQNLSRRSVAETEAADDAFLKTTEDTFLGDVPVRFRILNPGENYHIPLLVSPWSYTTYRGS